MELSKVFKSEAGFNRKMLLLVGCCFVLASSSQLVTAATTTAAAAAANKNDASSKLAAISEPSTEPSDSSGALPESLDSIDLSPVEVDGSSGASSSELVSPDLLPKPGSLFQKDALDVEALQKMDCHLRNVDFCYAGMMGASDRMLPETDRQLEVRCDEMKAATSCVAIYNKRCQTFKVFGAMSMLISGNDQQSALNEMELPPALESALLGKEEPTQEQLDELGADKIKIGDLTSLCEPSAKLHKHNRLIRRRIFQIAKCINERMPAMKPCIEDLKTALQVFYEPGRSLPVQPTCCAITRFRACSMKALNNVCGLSSFEQLESSLASSSGAGSMMKTIQRVCRFDGAKGPETAACLEVLPPSGLKAPQRRGSKASKLAKALDLFSFSPAVQE